MSTPATSPGLEFLQHSYELCFEKPEAHASSRAQRYTGRDVAPKAGIAPGLALAVVYLGRLSSSLFTCRAHRNSAAALTFLLGDPPCSVSLFVSRAGHKKTPDARAMRMPPPSREHGKRPVRMARRMVSGVQTGRFRCRGNGQKAGLSSEANDTIQFCNIAFNTVWDSTRIVQRLVH
jgi:hypothetical protein